MITTTLLTLSVLAAPAAPVPAAEAHQWLRWCVPLPREAAIQGKVVLPARSVRVEFPKPATELDRATAEELSALLPGGGPAAFVLQFERPAALPASIANAPNRDQAYAIEPLRAADGSPTGLRCVAETDVGTCYAARTLKQLLAARRKEEESAATVEIPLLRVADWPDLEERGEWGGIAAADLEWMAERKLNLIEAHATITVDKQGAGHAAMDPELLARARRHAVRIVPIIHHLEQIARSGIFDVYPQLKAVGAEGSICFARPEIVTLVAQWLAELAKLPDVREVMIWLSEEGKGCTCPECAKDDRFVNETRACLAAWEKAKQAHPKLGLRLLTTQASHASNDKVLAVVPEGVKVSYYHGGLTYDTTRRPMIYPLLQEYVKRGRWLGVYPTVSANWLIVAPFTNPRFVHTRMNEFVAKGLRCLVAYAVPANAYYTANVEAAAEWSWDARGRSPREFAEAYALRRGMKDPARFAEWTETLSAVTWDVYGSSFPYREHWGGTDRVARGGAKLGQGVFAEFLREEQLDQDLAACRAALPLAQASGDPGAVLETRIVEGYVQILKSVWELGKLLPGHPDLKTVDRDAVRPWFDLLDQGCATVVALYPEWSNTVAPELKGKEPSRFWDTVRTMERFAGRMGALREECGLPDPNKPYRLHVLGEWKTEDFAAAREQTVRLDVSALVDAPGVYLFRPVWRSGTLGLGASRVALVSFPKDRPEETREEAADAHECHAGAWVKDDLYRLELKARDPERGYAVLAQVRGGPTTAGEFTFRKRRP